MKTTWGKLTIPKCEVWMICWKKVLGNISSSEYTILAIKEAEMVNFNHHKYDRRTYWGKFHESKLNSTDKVRLSISNVILQDNLQATVEGKNCCSCRS